MADGDGATVAVKSVDWFRVVNTMHTLTLDELRQRLVYEGYRVMFSASDDAAGVAGTRIDALQLMHHLPRHLLACLITRQPDMPAIDAVLDKVEQGNAGDDYKQGTPLELSEYLADMKYTDTYRDHVTQGLQLLSHLATIAPSVAGFGEALQQDAMFPEVTSDVCVLAMMTLAGPERAMCLEAARTPWVNETELRSWMALVDWVLMTLRNTHSWAGAGSKRALTRAVDGILRHPEADVLIPVSSEACSICLSAFRASLLAVQPGANPPQEAADLDFVAMANSIGGAMISLSYLITDPFLYHRCMQSEPNAASLLRLVEAGLFLLAPPLAPPPYTWGQEGHCPRPLRAGEQGPTAVAAGTVELLAARSLFFLVLLLHHADVHGPIETPRLLDMLLGLPPTAPPRRPTPRLRAISASYLRGTHANAAAIAAAAAAQGVQLGCSKCRYARGGCKACRAKAFGGPEGESRRSRKRAKAARESGTGGKTARRASSERGQSVGWRSTTADSVGELSAGVPSSGGVPSTGALSTEGPSSADNRSGGRAGGGVDVQGGWVEDGMDVDSAMELPRGGGLQDGERQGSGLAPSAGGQEVSMAVREPGNGAGTSGEALKQSTEQQPVAEQQPGVVAEQQPGVVAEQQPAVVVVEPPMPLLPVPPSTQALLQRVCNVFGLALTRPACSVSPAAVGEGWLLLNSMRALEYFSSDPAFHGVLLESVGSALVDALAAPAPVYLARWCAGSECMDLMWGEALHFVIGHAGISDSGLREDKALSDACDVLTHALPRPSNQRKGEKQRTATARRCCLEVSLLLFRILANLHSLHQEPSSEQDHGQDGSTALASNGQERAHTAAGSRAPSRMAVMLAGGGASAAQHVLGNLDAHCGFVAPLVENGAVRARVTWVDYLLLSTELAAVRHLIATVARQASLPAPPQATATPPAAVAPAAAPAQQGSRRVGGRQGRKQQMPSAAPTGTSLPPAQSAQPAQSAKPPTLSGLHRMAASSLAQAPIADGDVMASAGGDGLVHTVKRCTDEVDAMVVDGAGVGEWTTVNDESAVPAAQAPIADAAPPEPSVVGGFSVGAAETFGAPFASAAVPMAPHLVEADPSMWVDPTLEPKEEPLWGGLSQEEGPEPWPPL